MNQLSRVTLGFFVPWRLSGLLSGYLPTDTRPQARAKLGKRGNMLFDSASQQNFQLRDNFLAQARAAWRRAHTSNVEHEWMFMFFNELLRE
jgi:hypothetical protein